MVSRLYKSFLALAATTLLGALLALPGWSSPAGGHGSGVPVTDQWINQRYDWVIYIDAIQLDRFLSYKKSSVSPLTMIQAQYRFTGRNKKNDDPEGVFRYADFYFHEGQILGTHRYQEMPLHQNQQGCIWLRSSEASFSQSLPAMTSTVVRLLIDIYRGRSVLSSVYVPVPMFEDFSANLARYNFFKFRQGLGATGQNMSLDVSSDPTQYERYFYYDDSGR